MKELKNKMIFMAVKGAINEGMWIICIGGYLPCKKAFEGTKKKGERVFLFMEVDTWKTK